MVPRLGDKRHCSFSFTLIPLTLWEASYCVMRTLKEPCGEVHECEELRPLANSQHQLASSVNEPSWKWTLLPQSSSDDCSPGQLQSYERPPSQNHSANLLPNCWPTETVWNNIYILSFGVIYYTAIEKLNTQKFNLRDYLNK